MTEQPHIEPPRLGAEASSYVKHVKLAVWA